MVKILCDSGDRVESQLEGQKITRISVSLITNRHRSEPDTETTAYEKNKIKRFLSVFRDSLGRFMSLERDAYCSLADYIRNTFVATEEIKDPSLFHGKF